MGVWRSGKNIKMEEVQFSGQIESRWILDRKRWSSLFEPFDGAVYNIKKWVK